MTSSLAGADTSFDLFRTVLPFVIALGLALVSPLLIKRVKKLVLAQISSEAVIYKLPLESDSQPQQAPEAIGEYIEYAADAVQTLPLTLLPIVGAMLAISNTQASGGSVIALILTLLVAVVLDAWILSNSTPDYVSKKYLGYSIVPIVAVISNVAAIVMIMI